MQRWMMKHIVYISIVVLLIAGCNDTGETLLRYQGTVSCQGTGFGVTYEKIVSG